MILNGVNSAPEQNQWTRKAGFAAIVVVTNTVRNAVRRDIANKL